MNGLIFYFLIHVFIMSRRIQHKIMSQFSTSVNDTTVNSLLFTSIIWLARMQTARGTINDVLMKSHLLTFKGSIFSTFILLLNSLMRNSLILFMVVGLEFLDKSREGVCEIVAFLLKYFDLLHIIR